MDFNILALIVVFDYMASKIVVFDVNEGFFDL